MRRVSARSQSSSDEELLAAAVKKDEAAIRDIMQSHNRMLFRMARSILRRDDEAEDAVQAAYVRAFTSLATFRGEARLATWLGRIVLNEALGRARRERATIEIDALETFSSAEIIAFPLGAPLVDPERTMAQREIHRVVERAIDDLPEAFRMVLVARLVENMTVEDTANLLGVRPETVRTRLHRARALLRRAIEKQFGRVLHEAFPFGGERCRCLSDRVLAALHDRS